MGEITCPKCGGVFNMPEIVYIDEIQEKIDVAVIKLWEAKKCIAHNTSEWNREAELFILEAIRLLKKELGK